MTKKLIFKIAIGIFAIMGVYACQKDSNSNNTPFSDIWSLVNGNTYVLEMTYETEISSYQKVLVDRSNPNNKFFDIVASKPMVKKQSVVMKLKEDGTAYMESTEMAPQQAVPEAVHLSSPDNRPKVVKTVVDGTEMKLYGANGTLINTVTLGEGLKNTVVVQAIQEMKTKTNSAAMASSLSNLQLSSMFGLNLPEMEQQANSTGGSVIINSNLKLIKIPYNIAQKPEYKFLVITVDISKNLPLYMDITDEQMKAFSTISFQYDGMNGENPTLKSIHSATYDVSATGSDVVRHMNMTFSNVNAIIY